jgi:hypothetical protein
VAVFCVLAWIQTRFLQSGPLPEGEASYKAAAQSHPAGEYGQSRAIAPAGTIGWENRKRLELLP